MMYPSTKLVLLNQICIFTLVLYSRTTKRYLLKVHEAILDIGNCMWNSQLPGANCLPSSISPLRLVQLCVIVVSITWLSLSTLNPPATNNNHKPASSTSINKLCGIAWYSPIICIPAQWSFFSSRASFRISTSPDCFLSFPRLFSLSCFFASSNLLSSSTSFTNQLTPPHSPAQRIFIAIK